MIEVPRKRYSKRRWSRDAESEWESSLDTEQVDPGDQPVDPDQDHQRRSVEDQAYGDRGQASQVVLVEELGYGWQGPAWKLKNRKHAFSWAKAPGLVFMWGDSNARRHEFESMCYILDG